MEVGLGWHECFVTRDYILTQLIELTDYGVEPEDIKIVPISETVGGAEYAIYYYIGFET